MLLFINACVRQDESRTLRIAEPVVSALSKRYAVTRYDLPEMDIVPLDPGLYAARGAGEIPQWAVAAARSIAEADRIVIAAPFWDMSFPAVLKCYIENVCVNGMTFRYAENGVPQGLCRAKRAWYVATAGGYAGENLFGYGYIKTLFRDMFGIPETRLIIAEGLDIAGNDAEKILLEAIEKHTARG